MHRKTMLAALLTFVLGLLALAGCGRERPEAGGPIAMTEGEQEAWEIALVEARIQKNEQFLGDRESPLPASQHAGFEGLDYYYPNAGLRFMLTLQHAERPDTVQLAKAKGQQVPYVRRGTIEFRHEGRKHRLAVFGPADGSATPDYLWLPFYDRTNEDETYEGGRYLDLTLGPDGTVEVDFNRAYNPLCAYDHERFNCTLPPAENKLTFRVEAGEKRHVPPAAASEAPEAPPAAAPAVAPEGPAAAPTGGAATSG